MKLSRGFVCMLIGFAMTLFAWFGPWEWPGMPALFVMRKFFGGSYDGFAQTKRALVLLLLIAINSISWAIVAYPVLFAARVGTKKRDVRDEVSE